ncbi:PREDICTED: uncharacterized protein At4g02000-like [Erythranthe guttata]|uniref:uncharacterized protein At4g02000-like n=1 Tax=Erythranthe guttata TaxID=4155 RepID=UPI00064DCBA8|nr:PREDICTED: uncharacterized protein At4g02000-like [Erythranthe guttata]|eukprot:XP_012848359.1 PREDICTED: uncharacterized protein At4g02000-like [Erythranthe guttata]
MEGLAESLAKQITLTEEEEVGILLDPSDGEFRVSGNQISLVGRVVSAKEISFHTIKLNALRLLAPVKGCDIQPLGINTVLLKFNHVLDKKHALEGCPWVLERHAFIFHDLVPGEMAKEIDVRMMHIVVRLYRIPPTLKTPTVAKRVASRIGEFVQLLNEKTLDVSEYMRVKVSLDVKQRLKRGIYLHEVEGTKVWIDFKYERLPAFCFLCGVLGHSENKCPARYEDDFTDPGDNLPYGIWMRAPNLRDEHHTRLPLQPISENTLAKRTTSASHANESNFLPFKSRETRAEGQPNLPQMENSTPLTIHDVELINNPIQVLTGSLETHNIGRKFISVTKNNKNKRAKDVADTERERTVKRQSLSLRDEDSTSTARSAGQTRRSP